MKSPFPSAVPGCEGADVRPALQPAPAGQRPLLQPAHQIAQLPQSARPGGVRGLQDHQNVEQRQCKTGLIYLANILDLHSFIYRPSFHHRGRFSHPFNLQLTLMMSACIQTQVRRTYNYITTSVGSQS